MSHHPCLIPAVSLSGLVPEVLPPPKFQIGQRVCWSETSTQDFGRVIGIVWVTEASTQALGYHYAVQLDINSPSTVLGVGADWGYEADLSLMPASLQTNADAVQLAPSQDANF